jgi:hypothetical protein
LEGAVKYLCAEHGTYLDELFDGVLVTVKQDSLAAFTYHLAVLFGGIW